MSEKKIHVKWGNQSIHVPVHAAMNGKDLKEELSCLLGIPTNRQKILGAKISDSQVLPDKVINGNQSLLLIGTAEKSTELRSTDEIVHASEYSSKDHIANYLHKELLALANVGNTCYLNGALQILRGVKELRIIFEKKLAKQAATDPLLNELRKLMLASGESNASNQSTLIAFVKSFHNRYPTFAERSSETGHFLQHDSCEALNVLLSHIQEALSNAGGASYEDSDCFEDLFQIGTQEVFECTEASPNEQSEKQVKYSTSLMVVCHLQTDTSSIEQGIQSSFGREMVEKYSEQLGKNTFWEKTSSIKKLPRYLFVHIARFAWRQDTAQRAKILKSVNFPLLLNPSRIPQVDPIQGEYSLVSVVSHKGRNADQGHYVAWCKQTIELNNSPPVAVHGKTDPTFHSLWVVLDDDCSSIVSEEDIKRLRGGGEYHSAYILLYKRTQRSV